MGRIKNLIALKKQKRVGYFLFFHSRNCLMKTKGSHITHNYLISEPQIKTLHLYKLFVYLHTQNRIINQLIYTQMKTHFKKLRNPNYVGSWDLADENGNYQDKTVTITEVKKEMVHDGKGGQEECTVVAFKEVKPMVANSTNLRTIAKLCGSPYIEDWNGKQITLTVQKVKAFGEYHDAIRVKAASNKPKEKPTLSDDRFKAALKAIAEGKTKKETVINQFNLTSKQNAELQAIN